MVKMCRSKGFPAHPPAFCSVYTELAGLFNKKRAQDKRDEHEGEHHFIPQTFAFEEIEKEDENHIRTDDSVKGEDHSFYLSISI